MTAPVAAITILMADDDPDDRLMMQDAFRACGPGPDLRFVRDGEELLDWLRSNPLPGLVLLDLNMPRKDGREALREIRADAALRHLPVVVLSTSSAEEDMARARADGVDAFLTKPVTADGMAALVRGLARYWQPGGAHE